MFCFVLGDNRIIVIPEKLEMFLLVCFSIILCINPTSSFLMTESVSKVRVLACAENKFSKGLATQSEIRRPAAWRLARNAESQAHHTY